MKEDFSFDYIQKLCQAIEELTASQEGTQPDIFRYRGANLKYAVERALYFSAVDNPRLRSFFHQWIGREQPKITYFRTEIDKQLAFYLCNKKIDLNRLQLKYQAFYSLYSWQKRFLSQLLLKLEQKGQPGQVLLAINHKKFARFLSPIVEKLPFSCSYLLHPGQGLRSIVENKKLQSFLKKNNLPFINLQVPGSFPKALIVPEVVFLYNCYYTTLVKTKPRCIIVIEGNHVHDEIINQIGKQLSIPVICLQQGWSPIVHNGFRNMSYTKMLVWGQGFADLLQPYNLEQKFVVTGSHVVHKNKSSFNHATRGVSFFLQSPYKLGTRESWDQFLELVLWTAQKFGNTPVLVREHPQFPLSEREQTRMLEYANVKLVPSKSYSLATVLAQSLLVVAIYSTTILEGIAAGVLPLIVNVTSMPSYYPNVQAAGAGIEVKSLEAAKQVIERAISDPNYMQQFANGIQQFQNQYFAHNNSQQAIQRTIEEISETANATVGRRNSVT